MLVSFPKIPKMYRPKALKIDVFDYYPLSFYTSKPGNPHEYPHKTHIARN